MALFRYIAIDQEGKTVQAVAEQQNRSELINALIKQKMRPVSIKEVQQKKTGFSLNANISEPKVKPDQLVLFTRQLSAMISAGVPLLRALNGLYSNQPEKSPLKKILAGVVEDVEGGTDLHSSLAKYPKVFDDIYINMVAAGEAAGILDEILDRLATKQENSMSMRKKIKSTMSYPIVLLIITIIAFFGLMIFVVPQIGKIVTDLSGGKGKLPTITLVMLAISHFMVSYWYILVGGFVGSIVLITQYIRTPKGKYQFHYLLIKTPIIKDLITKVVVANFARTFSALIEAGVDVLEAIDVTSRAVGNKVYEKSLVDAEKLVKNGQMLSVVLAKDPLYPPIVPQMLAVGEETGQTGKVLVKVADFYEEEVNTSIAGLSSLIEPIMIVIMGGIVGLIAASVMLPIAQLSQTIQ